MNLKAKFHCDHVIHQNGGGRAALLYPVAGPENASFSKWTPAGKLEITVTNPDAKDFFEPGKCYFLDIIPADQAAESQ